MIDAGLNHRGYFDKSHMIELIIVVEHIVCLTHLMHNLALAFPIQL